MERARSPDSTAHTVATFGEAKDNWQLMCIEANAHEGPEMAQKVLLVPFNAA